MLKKVFNISIISSVLLFLFGLVLAVNAEGFIKSITVAIGVVLLLIGVFPVIDYFRYRKEGLGASVGLISGIFSIVCGLMLLINEDLLMILIPVFIGQLLEQGKLNVKVLRTDDTWYGMTYKEDVITVKERFSEMLENKFYSEELFNDISF